MDLFESAMLYLKDDGKAQARFASEGLQYAQEGQRAELVLLMEQMCIPVAQPVVVKTIVPICTNCKQKFPFKQNTSTCPNCACVNPDRYLDTTTLPPRKSYKGTPSGVTYEKKKQGYSRLPFFQAHRRELNGHATHEIPEEVYEMVYAECKKRKYTEVTRAEVRNILKKRKRPDMYKSAIAITFAFNNVQPPMFTQMQETILDGMFIETEIWFELCPEEIKQRESMIGYNYLIYKFCHLHGWDEFLPQIKLPQEDTVKKYDRIFKWICKNRNVDPVWTFYKTNVHEFDM